VLENVKAILDDQKLTFANVVKSTVFLTNLADFAGMNEVYAKYFTGDFPARSTIQVAALPLTLTVRVTPPEKLSCMVASSNGLRSHVPPGGITLSDTA
jgi:enamine deaminase RidA (YjgF/YER057c/UK114 family)